MSAIDIIAIIISIIAICISALTYWNNSLKSFKLKIIDAGRVQLVVNPYRAPNREPAIMVGFFFFNEGAKIGVVQDVALRVKFPAGDDILFRSMVIATDHTHQLSKELVPPKLESFIGFDVSGRSSKFKDIMFVFDEPNKLIDFPLGQYTVEILAISSSAQEWQSQGSFAFSVEDNDLEVLAKSTFTLQEDGRYFLPWYIQSKVTEERKMSLKVLKHSKSN